MQRDDIGRQPLLMEMLRVVTDDYGIVEARFERRSVLATTAIILGTAVALVLFSVALALFLIVRKGRTELALENAHTSTVHRR